MARAGHDRHMKIVFFGTPDWAVPALELLARSRHSPILVVTQPPKRRERGGAASSSPVARACSRLGLPVVEPESVREDALLAHLAAQSPDFIVVVAYGKIF